MAASATSICHGHGCRAGNRTPARIRRRPARAAARHILGAHPDHRRARRALMAQRSQGRLVARAPDRRGDLGHRVLRGGGVARASAQPRRAASDGVSEKSWCETMSWRPFARAPTSAATSPMIFSSSSMSAHDAAASASRNRSRRTPSPAVNQTPLRGASGRHQDRRPRLRRARRGPRRRPDRAAGSKTDRRGPPPDRTGVSSRASLAEGRERLHLISRRRRRARRARSSISLDSTSGQRRGAEPVGPRAPAVVWRSAPRSALASGF